MEEISKSDIKTLEQNPSNRLKILLCLFIGSLSIFFAEVFSGSLPLWFINVWGLVVVFPLYLMHLLFLLNIAMRTERTSIPQLYLWGVIFALYESWITKVLWYGYPDSEGAQFGLFLGIAFGEFIVLVFFFHPIFSFVIPILVFEIFVVPNESTDNLESIIFTNHLTFFKKNKKVLCFWLFIILLGASFVSIGSGYNLFLALLASIGSICIIFLLYYIIKFKTKRNPSVFSIHSLKFGKLGLSIVSGYLILLYIIMFFFLLPERLPNSPIPYIIIIGFYTFIGIMLYLSKPLTEPNFKNNIVLDRLTSVKDMMLIFGLLILLVTIFCLIPFLTIIIRTVIYLIIFLVGTVFFIIMLIMALKK